MREHDLELLELPAVLGRLAAAAASEPGALLADSLRPAADAIQVRLRQQRTTEAISLLDEAAEPDLGGAADVSAAADLAARGSTLDTRTLAQVESTIRAGVTAQRALGERHDIPALLELVAGIDPSLLSVAEEIGRAVEEDGSDLKDSASPPLRRLRRELREGRGRLAERLRKIARDPAVAEHLQDDFVTERGGRPGPGVEGIGSRARAGHRARLLRLGPDALRRATRGRRRLEPAARGRGRRARRGRADPAQPLLARCRAGGGARRRSCARRRSSTSRSPAAASRAAGVERSWPRATTSYCAGRGTRCSTGQRPSRSTSSSASLRALVISGPNTGGKTVALKTLGLAAVLHQCGLRPPADEAALPVFDAILVDIGDEQSIAMSLSTFSAHVHNLVGILETATEHSLVLLDEIAAGTDPVEGAALAEALLDRARAPGSAHRDDEPLRRAEGMGKRRRTAPRTPPPGSTPTTTSRSTRVTLGRPGTSHALQTAERLGLPEPIVAAARSKVAPERLRVAELVAEAEAAARRRAGELAAAAAERQDAEAARLKAERAAEGLQDEIEQVRASAAAERQRALARGRDGARGSAGRARGAARRDSRGAQARA